MQTCRTFAYTGTCRYGKRCGFNQPDTSTDHIQLHSTSLQTDTSTPCPIPFFTQDAYDQHHGAACNPQTYGYTTPEVTPPYPHLVPDTYQDHFLSPRASFFASAQASPAPYQTGTEYTASETHSALTRLSAASMSTADTVDAEHLDLLGQGYTSQDFSALGRGPLGVQPDTSPRGVLEYAVMQGYGCSPVGSRCSHAQVGADQAMCANGLASIMLACLYRTHSVQRTF